VARAGLGEAHVEALAVVGEFKAVVAARQTGEARRVGGREAVRADGNGEAVVGVEDEDERRGGGHEIKANDPVETGDASRARPRSRGRWSARTRPCETRTRR